MTHGVRALFAFVFVPACDVLGQTTPKTRTPLPIEVVVSLRTHNGRSTVALSPDGQWMGFGSGGMLRAVPLAGGAPRTLTEAPNLAGASWGAGDTIVYSSWSSGLLKVSAQGGRPELLTMLDERQGDTGHVSPHVLPRGTSVLFTVDRPTGEFVEAVEIATGRRRPIVEGRNPVYLPTGHLVFARGSALFRDRQHPAGRRRP